MKPKETRGIGLLCFWTALLVSVLLLVPRTAGAAELTEQEVAVRFEEIADRYSMGDTLSEEDAAFVRQYARRADLREQLPPGYVPRRAQNGSANVNTSRTMYGVAATLTGSVWHTGTVAYTWGATLTGRIASGSTPKKMTVSAKVQAYGLASSDSITLAYTKTLSNTTYGKRTVQMSKSDSYSGVILYYYVTYQLDVTTASSSAFTVQSNW